MERIKLSFVNAYLLEAGEGFILIDTGVPGKWGDLEAILLKKGVLPDRLKLVIMTHGDQDHIGNGAILQSKYKVPIAMHHGDTLMAEAGTQPNRTNNSFLMKLMMKALDKIEKHNKNPFATFKPDIYVTDGQSLEPYGSKDVILHTPGHTKGSIVIFTQEKDLICGDLFTNMTKPGLSPIVESEEDRIVSVKRVRDLKIRNIYPGHGAHFSSVYFFGYNENQEIL